MDTFTQRIRIVGVIDEASTEQWLAEIRLLDRRKPLAVWVNSDGGSVPHAMALVNAIQGWPGGSTATVSGWALSAASLIFVACDKRQVYETSLLMVHAPWTGASGNAASLRSTADALDTAAEAMLAVYRRTGQSERVIRSWLDGQDHWFIAQDAVRLGIANELISEPSQAYASHRVSIAAIPAAISAQLKGHNTMSTAITTEIDASINAAAELKRRDAIAAKFAGFTEMQGVPALQARLERDPSVTPEAAAQQLLAFLAKDMSPVAGHFISTDASPMADFKRAAVDTLLARAGIPVADPHPAAKDLQRLTIVNMAERCLSMSGKLIPSSREQIIAAAQQTGDFPGLLEDLMHKSLRAGYGEAGPTSHTVWTARREVQDFREHSLVNLSEAPGLLKVAEGGEYSAGHFSDAASKVSVATFGRVIGVTRQALVNDDLGALTQIPRALGAAAMRLEADTVYKLLLGNPKLTDGKTLFHADHNNIGTPAALSVASLAEGRSKMRQQKGIGGIGYLDIAPRFLLVGPELETDAEQLLASLVDRDRVNDTINPGYIRGLQLVVDPRIEGRQWFLAASPTTIESMVRVHLAGEAAPYFETNSSFWRDQVETKVRHDFGAGVIDYRGLFRNAGPGA